ncbi:MAG TPA: YbhB/YbcL family Raf kinase inhibitor-like protein [Gaiellales bacterium]|jgi:Raf kinase inhibitor-like YbhB/YbcL family protein|nr:YbhB/YbcL family Raf kinase inhibitor-like protein [Gaiellales bacterium]
MADFTLSSSAFGSGEPIPVGHSCEGEDRSPPLRWSDAPPDAGSLALVLDDPDAPGGTFTHWLGWGIDPAANGLGEGEAAPVEGENDFGSTGYRGPCPPPGHGPHRYVFRLYALPGQLDLAPGAGRKDFERALPADTLGAAELVGTYER